MFLSEEQKRVLNLLETHWSSNPKVINDNTYLLFHLDRLNENNYGLPVSEERKAIRNRRKTILKDIVKHILGRI